MRHTPKQPPPTDYARFVATVDDPRTANWNRLKRKRHAAAYAALWQSLLAEQGHVCVYCGARVARRGDERAPDAGHIEHVLPKADGCFPERKFAYDNLTVSCQGHLVGRQPREPRHCGAAKGDWPRPGDELAFVSPLDPQVAAAFRYLPDGGVRAADGPRARAAAMTITRLKLDHPRLVEVRQRAIDAWIELIERGIELPVAPAPGEPAEPYLAALVDVLGRWGFGQ